MCVAIVVSIAGEIIDDVFQVPANEKIVFGFGKLLDSENGLDLEIAVLENEGNGNLEIISERVVKGTFEEIVQAFQDLGFTILEEQCRRMFDFIQTLLGEKKKN